MKTLQEGLRSAQQQLNQIGNGYAWCVPFVWDEIKEALAAQGVDTSKIIFGIDDDDDYDDSVYWTAEERQAAQDGQKQADWRTNTQI